VRAMADGKKRGKTGKPAKKRKTAPALPPVIVPKVDAPAVRIGSGSFDVDDRRLPAWVEREALSSGGFPYDEAMKDKPYEAELEGLQVELVKLQHHVGEKGLRIVLIFEGRDAAGKGGCILVMREFLNPRYARQVALPKPNDAERGQWYFQRYIAHLPTAGEMVFFDRSWYNRAGVEPVMGFCTPAEHRRFLQAVPDFEKMLVDDGILLFKFWLSIGRAMQLKRFHDRRHDPLKVWKLSPIDYAAMAKWDEYTRARDELFAAAHNDATPWTVVLANDKRRARLNLIRHVLAAVNYPGKDGKIVGRPDPLILNGPEILGQT
jgi:polyphosphate kinase